MKTAAALLFVAALAQAQMRETVTVEVVEVPVYVHAPDGTPVRGLTREAFQLFVDGKPQAIEYFDVMDFEGRTLSAPTGGGAQRPPADQRVRRLYLFLFDLATMSPKDLGRVQKAATEAVMRSNPATDFFAVAMYRPRDGVRFSIPFTTDRAVIARAIATLDTRDHNDPLRISNSSKLLATRQLADASDKGLPLALSAGELGLSGDMLEAVVGGLANYESAKELLRHRVRDKMSSFGDTAARLAAMQGQKHVVLFSTGFRPDLLWDSVTPMLGPELGALMRSFVAAGAMLDSVDVVGNRSSAEQESLYRMSSPTGGQVLTGIDISASLARLTASHDVVYLLGFRRRDNRGGAINVRVNGIARGTVVSFRTGYGAPAARGELDALQLADIVLNDVPQNGLTATVAVEPRDGGALVTMSYRPAEVAAQLVAEKPWLEAMLYIFDETGRAALYQAGRLPISDSMDGVFHKTVSLPPGHYTAKLLLNVGGTQSAGFARAEFDVPPK